MKATRQQLMKPAAARKAQARTQTPVRHRRRRDSLEAQAELAAARFARGERELGRALGRAPAAPDLAGGEGRPLPAPLRAELETAFGAELAAVRLHTGAEAAAVAAAEGALAFTAGPDIFFAAGAYGSGAAGEALVAHEVAHVLQQTGRAGPGGALRATTSYGAGEIQLVPDRGKQYIERWSITFESLKAVHNVAKDAKLKAFVDKTIAPLLTPAGGSAPVLDATLPGVTTLADKVFAGDFDPGKARGPTRSFVYDLMKLLDRFDAAGHILAVDPLVPTYAWMLDWGYEYIDSVPPTWFFPVVEGDPRLKVFFSLFMDTYRQLAYSPTRGVQSLKLAEWGTLADEKDRLVKRAAEATGPVENELVFLAADLLQTLDTSRVEVHNKIYGEALSLFPGPLSVDRAYLIAAKLLDNGAELQKSAVLPDLFGPLGQRIEAIGKGAMEFWHKAINEAKGASISTVVAADKVLSTTVPQALSASAKILFKLAKDNTIPTDAQYDDQRKRAIAPVVEVVRAHLDPALLKLARKDPVPAEAVVYGWMAGRLDRYERHLDSYKLEDDQAYQKKHPGYADVRVAHRVRAARELQTLADRVLSDKTPAWSLLTNDAWKVVNSNDVGGAQLALLSGWEPEKGVSVQKFGEDFGKGIFELGDKKEKEAERTNIPGPVLARLLLGLYYQDIAVTIGMLLDRENRLQLPPEQALKERSILSRAIDQANSAARPTRYIVRDFVFAPLVRLDSDEPDTSGATLRALVEVHPKTREFATRESSAGHYVILPTDAIHEVFAWVIPDLQAVFTLLRSDEAGLNTFIAEANDQDVADVELLTDEEWIQELSALPEWTLKVKEFQERWLEERIKELHGKMREAVSHDRRLLAALLTRELPQYTGRADTTWDLPLVALDTIQRFAAYILPRDDQPAQVAALFLGIAQVLAKALADEDRFDIITGYYSYVVLGIRHSEGKKLEDLERVTTPDELKELLKGRAALVKLRDHLDEQRRKVQARFGFKSEDGKTLKSLVYAAEIGPGKPFEIDGDQYELVSVSRAFTYNPPYGMFQGPDAEEGAGGYKPPMLDGKEYQPKGEVLLTIKLNGRELAVKDSDQATLDHLSYVIEMRANVIGLEKLAETMEESIELMLDAAELIPGAGQALAAARIVAMVAHFVASGEFDEIRSLVAGDPVKLLEQVQSELKAVLEPEKLWEYLLFGGKLMAKLHEEPPDDEKVKRTRRRKKGLAGILAGIRRIGKRLALGLDAVYTHVQVPVQAFQASLLARPRLTFAVTLLAEHIEALAQLKKLSSFGEMQKAFKAEEQELKLRVEQIVGGLAALELPEKVVPVERIVEWIITLILDRLGTKGKIARRILELTGMISDVRALVMDGLKATGLDPEYPNTYWRETVVAGIKTDFVTARNSFVDALYALLNDPPLSLGLQRPAAADAGSIDVHLEGDNSALEDKEASGYGGLEPDAAAIAALPPPGPGAPLAPPLRDSAERRFGHDFGHVRLHQGGEAAPVTRAFGAEGLASGSHVFLGPGLSPHAGRGAHILDHELGHVLQQTGARPLGRPHDQRPRLGAPTPRLQADGAKEAEAEDLARAAATGPARAPRRVTPGEEEGYQPAGVGLPTLKRLLNRLTTYKEAREAQREIDERAAKGPADIDGRELAIAEAIWDEVWQLFNDGKAGLPARPVLDANKLKAHLGGKRRTDVNKALPHLARRATATRTKKEPGGTVTRTQVLNVATFGALLQAYVTARTGILFSIDVRPRTASGGRPAKGWVEKVQVSNLLLQLVSTNADLWKTVLANTGVTGADVEKLRPHMVTTLWEAATLLNYEDTSGGGSAVPKPIWHTTKYAFSADFVAFARFKEQQRGTDVPEDVPTKSQYLAFNASQTHSLAGVRIGVYGDNNQSGQNRESHHTTQYLLIEYFRNQSKAQPFTLVGRETWKALGVHWDGKETTASFTHPTEGTIDFKALDTGDRADAMPAILLSRLAHRTANLHIKGEPPEDFVESVVPKPKLPTTQGGALNNYFTEIFYQGDLKTLAGAYNAETFDGLARGKEQLIQDRLYEAIQGSYQKMYRHMMGNLKEVMPAIETGYYRQIAEKKYKDPKDPTRLQKDYDLQETDFGPIFTEAKRKNDEVMGKHGWEEPT